MDERISELTYRELPQKQRKQQSSAATPVLRNIRHFVKPPTGLVSPASLGEQRLLQAVNDWQNEVFAMAAKHKNDARKQMQSWNSSPSSAFHAAAQAARPVSLPVEGLRRFGNEASSLAEHEVPLASIDKLLPSEARSDCQGKDGDQDDHGQLTHKQRSEKVLRIRNLILF